MMHFVVGGIVVVVVQYVWLHIFVNFFRSKCANVYIFSLPYGRKCVLDTILTCSFACVCVVVLGARSNHTNKHAVNLLVHLSVSLKYSHTNTGFLSINLSFVCVCVCRKRTWIWAPCYETTNCLTPFPHCFFKLCTRNIFPIHKS